ncbi:MAG: hypothetical protein PSY14_06745 [bacterium]|nr:hypothetical protein [bacterium]
MKELVRNTPGGILPSDPSIESILKNVMGQGFSGLDVSGPGKVMKDEQEKPNEELKRAYAAVFNSPRAQMVLEDMLDMTLRRSPYRPTAPGQMPLTIEQQAAYGLERMGQNSTMLYIARMISEGQELPEPKAQKSNIKKKG